MSLLNSMRCKLTAILVLLTCAPLLIMGVILAYQAAGHILDQAEDRLAGVVKSVDSALAPNLKGMIERDPALSFSRLPPDQQDLALRKTIAIALRKVSADNPQLVVGFRGIHPDLFITMANGTERLDAQPRPTGHPLFSTPPTTEAAFDRVAVNRRYVYGAPVLRDGVLLGQVFACTPDTDVTHAVSRVRGMTLVSLIIALIAAWCTARLLSRYLISHLFISVQQMAAGAATSHEDLPDFAPVWGLLRSLFTSRSTLAQDLLNVIPMGVILYNSDLKCAYVNHYYAGLLGIPASECVGASYEDITRRIFPPEELGTRILPAVHMGQSEQVRQRQTVISSTGERIPVETLAFPFDTAERPQGVICLVHDLRQDEDLARMRKILSFVNEASPAGMVIVDQNGAITEFNQAMTKVCHLPRQNAIGQQISNLFPSLALRLDGTSEFRNQTIYCPCPNWQVEPICPCNQHGRQLVVDGTVTRDGRGTVTGMILVFRDITQLKEMEGQLHEALQQAQFLLDALDVGVIAVDSHACISVFNQVAETATGLVGTDLHGQEIDRLALASDLGGLLLNSLREGLHQRNLMYAWQVDGEKHEFIIDCSALRNTQDQIAGAMAMFRDITTLRKLQRDIERSEKLAVIGQLAAGTAHEIRNPLTTVRGFLQLLREKCHRQDWLHEVSYIDLMLSEIDRINHVISEFLMLSKERPALLQALNLDGLLTDISAILASEALLRGINLSTELPDSPVPILGDREQLKQVFLNLATNAFQAMEAGGSLTIRMRSDGERVSVDVMDTGGGIPPEAQSKIFDPFFTTKEEGTGLGLAICNRIIHDHHGEIRVDSSIGEGTTVTVEMPVWRGLTPGTREQE